MNENYFVGDVGDVGSADSINVHVDLQIFVCFQLRFSGHSNIKLWNFLNDFSYDFLTFFSCEFSDFKALYVTQH